MPRRPTVLRLSVALARTAPLFVALASLLVAGCSSSSSSGSGGSKDATADTHVTTAGDGGHGKDGGGGSTSSDATTDADGHGADAPDEATTRLDAQGIPDGPVTPDSGSMPDATTLHDAGSDALAPAESGTGSSSDAQADGPVDDTSDAPVETHFDAGPAALRFIGRTLENGTSADGNGTCSSATPCYEWSGTQVVARFSGATAIDFLMSDYGSYFDVYVDGTLASGGPIVGDGSTTSYPVATGLDPSKTHEVSLYKRTEASLNGRTMIQGVSFPNGGALLPPAAPYVRKIEVVGDSISCGYGVLGPNATCTEEPSLEDHDDSYGAITARNVGADLYTIASSGRGVYENIDGTTTGTLPDVYGYALPYPGNGVAPVAWDFANWTPDAVVINLGTNDFFGAPSGDPGQPFVAAYLAFVKTIRQNYPNAYILCTNGPMLSGTTYSRAQTYIQSVVSTLNGAGDTKVAYLAFPTELASNGAGCDDHPSVTTQGLMATQLTAALKTALGW